MARLREGLQPAKASVGDQSVASVTLVPGARRTCGCYPRLAGVTLALACTPLTLISLPGLQGAERKLNALLLSQAPGLHVSVSGS